MLIRALLRAALLAGLVICGWLLGSATALAAEDAPHQARPAVVLDDGNSLGTAHGDLSATAPTVPGRVDGLLRGALPAATAPQLPAAPPVVSGLVSRVVQPVIQPVLAPVSPVPAIQPPVHLTAPPGQATAPAAPAAAAIQVPAAPLPQVAMPAPATPLQPDPVAAAPSVYRSATLPAVDRTALHGDRSGAPGAPTVPPGPLDRPATSCPAGPAGATNAAPGAPTSVLPDTATSAEVGPLQRFLPAGTGALPRWLSQRPSTSPD